MASIFLINHLCKAGLANYQGTNSCYQALAQVCSDYYAGTTTADQVMSTSDTCRQLVWSKMRPVYPCDQSNTTEANPPIVYPAPQSMTMLLAADTACLTWANNHNVSVFDPANGGKCSPSNSLPLENYSYCLYIACGYDPSNWWGW